MEKKLLKTIYHDGNPPKSTFQQRSKNFIPCVTARYAMAIWRAILEKEKPPIPYEGPLELQLILTWEYPKSIRKKNAKPVQSKTTRPDGVNILKMVEDIMTDLGYWHDDAQLSIETVERYFGIYPGVLIQIYQIKE